jgi:DNA-binding MltR family transcriptional regulator
MVSSDPPKFPHLHHLTWNEFLDVLEELEKDGPRGAALLGHAMLENILKRLLLHAMVPLGKEEEDRLFDGLGPLSGMSSRTILAYALGLISKQTRRDLDKIRAIRNRFAHTGKKVTFDDPEVVKLCARLALQKQDLGARKIYVASVKALTIHLLGLIGPDATP